MKLMVNLLTHYNLNEEPIKEDLSFDIIDDKVYGVLSNGTRFIGAYDKEKESLELNFVRQIGEDDFEVYLRRHIPYNTSLNVIQRELEVDYSYTFTVR